MPLPSCDDRIEGSALIVVWQAGEILGVPCFEFPSRIATSKTMRAGV